MIHNYSNYRKVVQTCSRSLKLRASRLTATTSPSSPSQSDQHTRGSTRTNGSSEQQRATNLPPSALPHLRLRSVVTFPACTSVMSRTTYTSKSLLMKYPFKPDRVCQMEKCRRRPLYCRRVLTQHTYRFREASFRGKQRARLVAFFFHQVTSIRPPTNVISLHPRISLLPACFPSTPVCACRERSEFPARPFCDSLT